MASDLVFVVHQLPHARFERRGDDLHLTVGLALADALTGPEVVVAGLDGRQLQLPTRSLVVAPDTLVRLPGEGMPISKPPAGRKGDLLVHFDIKFPGGRLNEQQKAAIKQALAA